MSAIAPQSSLGRRRASSSSLAEFLQKQIAPRAGDPMQEEWFASLRHRAAEGAALYEAQTSEGRRKIDGVFRDWVRTEELKAWYGEPSGDSLFNGTSISSLTVPCQLRDPLVLRSVAELEESIADHYIALHDRHEASVRDAILEDTSRWRSEGLYYGVVLGAKIISQAFGLVVDAEDVVFSVDGVKIDPHELTSYPPEIRAKYFKRCKERIACFRGIPGLTQSEFESSLVLSDISKPRIEALFGRLLLAPVRCNEICSLLSEHVTRRIRAKTRGRIAPRTLGVTIYDTDTPYTYHQINGYFGHSESPVLPGLVVLGSSGSIDAFRWLYAYRVSLLAQKMMKSSLWSEASRCFVPFVFFGVLVERDAEILLDLDRLRLLRYGGNLSPRLEFAYLVPKILEYLEATTPPPLEGALERELAARLP